MRGGGLVGGVGGRRSLRSLLNHTVRLTAGSPHPATCTDSRDRRATRWRSGLGCRAWGPPGTVSSGAIPRARAVIHQVVPTAPPTRTPTPTGCPSPAWGRWRHGPRPYRRTRLEAAGTSDADAGGADRLADLRRRRPGRRSRGSMAQAAGCSCPTTAGTTCDRHDPIEDSRAGPPTDPDVADRNGADSRRRDRQVRPAADPAGRGRRPSRLGTASGEPLGCREGVSRQMPSNQGCATSSGRATQETQPARPVHDPPPRPSSVPHAPIGGIGAELAQEERGR